MNEQIAKALIAARKRVNATVYKGGFNQAQRYKYVGHEQVLTSGARDALLESGLVLVQTSVTYTGTVEYETKNGRQSCMCWIGGFLLAHESGEGIELSFSATTGTNDKAAFVASTALDRTAHMRVLALAGTNDEDPEDDSHDQHQNTARGGERAESRPTVHAQNAAPGTQEYSSPANGASSRATPSQAGQTERPRPGTDEQAARIKTLFAELGVTMPAAMRDMSQRLVGVSSSKDLTFDQANTLISKLGQELINRKQGK